MPSPSRLGCRAIAATAVRVLETTSTTIGPLAARAQSASGKKPQYCFVDSLRRRLSRPRRPRPSPADIEHDGAVAVGAQGADTVRGQGRRAWRASGGRRGCRRRPRSPPAAGAMRSSRASRPASSLPWWATLSTSTGPGSSGTASASASAVSSIEKSRQRASRTSACGSGRRRRAGRRAARAAARGHRAAAGPSAASPPAAIRTGVDAGGLGLAAQAPAEPARRASRPTGKRAEQLLDPARVVGLVVGDDRGAEPLDPGGAQLRRETVAGRPAVDEHRRRAGRLQQDRVALADVEDGDPQAARPAPAASPPPAAARPAGAEPSDRQRRQRRRAERASSSASARRRAREPATRRGSAGRHARAPTRRAPGRTRPGRPMPSRTSR